MDGGARGEFGMEGGHHVAALFDPDGVLAVGGEHAGGGADAADDGGADEDGLDDAFRGVEACDTAVDLAAVAVALDVDVQDLKAGLRGMGDVLGKEDGSGAGTEDGLLGREVAEGSGELLHVKEFEHGGAFAARDDEAVAGVHLRCGADFEGARASVFNCLAVCFEVALECQDADGLGHCYHPRVCSSSSGAILATSRPRMGSPQSRLASRSLAGSLK